MKKILSLIASGLFLSGMVLTSCEGPEGPQGPDGPQGPAGENGIATCGQCHDLSTDMYAKVIQWETSMHAIGGHFERNTAECAICHTHEGYVDNLATGAGVSDAALENPTPVNCRTCHKIHDTYTDTDWDLRATAPVTFFNEIASADLGTGNLCATCHQSRAFTYPVEGGEQITVTSTRYGPHHGPQSDVLNSNCFYLFDGSVAYPSTNPHLNVPNSCVACHMATGYGVQNGGHTFRMLRTDAVTLNVNGCTSCHSSTTFAADVTAFKEEIAVLHDSLGTMLQGLGYLNSTFGTVAGTYDPEVAGAMLNFKTIEEDKSEGVHNPNYVKAVLINTIEAVNAGL